MRHVVFYVLLGKVALPALTRVTRLDSNFDPVPGSTVPRIAPSLLVTYAHHDEEVHVALPPVKTNNSHSNSSHYGVINPAGRTQYQHISQRPAHYQQQQQQQQQSDNERSSSDGLRRRGVPCRGINHKFAEFAFLSFDYTCNIYKTTELGEGDCQGWLFRRRQTRGFFAGPRWTRRFFVLKRHTLYGYRDPEVNEKLDDEFSIIYLIKPKYFVLVLDRIKRQKA